MIIIIIVLLIIIFFVFAAFGNNVENDTRKITVADLCAKI